MNLNNSQLLNTYQGSNKELATTLIHTIPPPTRSNKHSRHTRKTITLPTVNHTITLSVIRSHLYQYTQLIMTSHLVVTTPNPRNVPWRILHTPQGYRHPSTYSNEIMFQYHVLPLDHHYYCWYPPIHQLANISHHSNKFDFMSTHLIYIYIYIYTHPPLLYARRG